MTELIANAVRIAHRPLNVDVWVALAILAVLIAVAGPVHALLVGALLGITMNRPLVDNGTKLGKMALQIGIVLLAFRMDISQLASISGDYLVWVGLYVPLTMLLGLAVARAMGIELALGKLISSGTAICGGTAIATLAPTIHARSDQLAIALSIVFLLNGVAMLTFPTVGAMLGLSQEAFGVWSALAVHDTSSVVATAAAYGEESLVVATTLKLGRTLFLIPVAFLFAWLQPRGDGEAQGTKIPTFVLLFVGATILNSLVSLPQFALESAIWASHAAFVVALFFVGTELRRTTLASIRGRALVYATGLWLGVVAATLAAVSFLI